MLQYTTLEVVTGLTTVQGQLVMVKVVDYYFVSSCSFLDLGIEIVVRLKPGSPSRQIPIPFSSGIHTAVAV